MYKTGKLNDKYEWRCHISTNKNQHTASKAMLCCMYSSFLQTILVLFFLSQTFIFGSEADFDPEWGTEWFKNLCLVWVVLHHLSVKRCWISVQAVVFGSE
jgi:hypothetical protein